MTGRMGRTSGGNDSRDSPRFVQKGGPFWGAEFEELCRGHRLYVLEPRAEPSEEIDLHRDPDGNPAGEPVPVEECYLCRRDANEHGYGLHGVSARGCPNCGAEVTPRTWKGRGAALNLQRCYECRPRYPTLGKPVRLVARLLGRVL